MKTLRKGQSDSYITNFQKFLKISGLEVEVNGVFDDKTQLAAEKFQSDNGLMSDGVIGRNSWKAIKKAKRSMKFTQGIETLRLKSDEFFHAKFDKKTIYLHHTAGGYRPDYTIGWWEKDNEVGKLRRVATAFVIGGKGRRGEDDFNGLTYRCFPEEEWAHHLGLRVGNNTLLNKESIGIEICSYGHLEKDNQGFYFKTKTSKIRIPEDQVCTLDKPWRGHKYFQKYTPEQIEETKRLILYLSYLYDIPIPERTYDRDWFDIVQKAFTGEAGIWTHANVRRDKTDCFPQPEFIDMLNSLSEAQKTFEPDFTTTRGGLGMDRSVGDLDVDPAELDNYAGDLEDIGME